jgi:hypothetical protein
VGEIHDHKLRTETEQVEPPGRAVGRWTEVQQAVADLRDRGAQAPCAAGGRERIRDVVPG